MMELGSQKNATQCRDAASGIKPNTSRQSPPFFWASMDLEEPWKSLDKGLVITMLSLPIAPEKRVDTVWRAGIHLLDIWNPADLPFIKRVRCL
jgi:hypothetical protein